MELLHLADLVLIFFTAPASLIFLLVYSVTRRAWWRSWLGWVIFSLAFSIVLTFGVSFAYLVLGPEYPGREFFKFGAYCLVGLAFIAKTIAVIYERRQGRKSKETNNDRRNPHS